jgi:hypothetical protein
MASRNLTTLLSQLRAPIFNTLAVESNARTGNKYLRRALRGPAVLDYVPQPRTPSLKALNSPKGWNQFHGWNGAPIHGDRPSPHLPRHLAIAEGWKEVRSRGKPGPKNLRPADAKFAQPAGWVEDPREYVRFKDVARKKRLGKGPPKKGESTWMEVSLEFGADCLQARASARRWARRSSSSRRRRELNSYLRATADNQTCIMAFIPLITRLSRGTSHALPWPTDCLLTWIHCATT